MPGGARNSINSTTLNPKPFVMLLFPFSFPLSLYNPYPFLGLGLATSVLFGIAPPDPIGLWLKQESMVLRNWLPQVISPGALSRQVYRLRTPQDLGVSLHQKGAGFAWSAILRGFAQAHGSYLCHISMMLQTWLL